MFHPIHEVILKHSDFFFFLICFFLMANITAEGTSEL